MQPLFMTQNYAGHERKIGIEIEYNGISLEKSATLIQELFGGIIHRESDAIYVIQDTCLGEFKLEIDAIALQKLVASTQEINNKSDLDIIDNITVYIGQAAHALGRTIVPFEIISPPTPLSKMNKLEILRKKLLDAGAKDTRQNIYMAFGLHLNPDVGSLEPHYIICHIQSYLLLAPWLKKIHNIDFSRRVTSFIDPFPKSYLQLILDKTYAPNIKQLIRDYYAHNHTRNRALDMLPLFAFIDNSLVRELYGTEEKIHKRPTFHYRLPNCELADQDWSFNTEWQRWLYVEKLAHHHDLLKKLITKWQTHQKKWLSFEGAWITEIEQHIMELS